MQVPSMLRDDLLTWGRSHRFRHHLRSLYFSDEAVAAMGLAESGRTMLARGLGRSYGDSALNADQILLDVNGLDRFIHFDAASGIVECEAGVTLAAILQLLETRDSDQRWFLPVTPGTKFVTVGGAIANDVHGKNHHRAGCFGNHVLSFQLLRSNGEILNCSPNSNPALFQATIGGLGLTGLILSARVALQAVAGLWLEAESFRYENLDRFHQISSASLTDWEYSVAWIDCLAAGANLGRGVFTRARHVAPAPGMDQLRFDSHGQPRLSLPFDLPSFAMNRTSIGIFNTMLWHKASARPRRQITHYDPVFYPLDAIGGWNRLYGASGFYQYQCVVPTSTARDAIRELLGLISQSGQASFLAVLKTFGTVVSPGMLSFPMPGVTLALDFPNRGFGTLALLDQLDRVTQSAGGRIYPAKDGRVSAAAFQQGYPDWRQFSTMIDPGFSSSFWRRVSAEAPLTRFRPL